MCLLYITVPDNYVLPFFLLCLLRHLAAYICIWYSMGYIQYPLFSYHTYLFIMGPYLGACYFFYPLDSLHRVLLP